MVTISEEHTVRRRWRMQVAGMALIALGAVVFALRVGPVESRKVPGISQAEHAVCLYERREALERLTDCAGTMVGCIDCIDQRDALHDALVTICGPDAGFE